MVPSTMGAQGACTCVGVSSRVSGRRRVPPGKRSFWVAASARCMSSSLGRDFRSAMCGATAWPMVSMLVRFL